MSQSLQRGAIQFRGIPRDITRNARNIVPPMQNLIDGIVANPTLINNSGSFGLKRRFQDRDVSAAIPKGGTTSSKYITPNAPNGYANLLTLSIVKPYELMPQRSFSAFGGGFGGAEPAIQLLEADLQVLASRANQNILDNRRKLSATSTSVAHGNVFAGAGSLSAAQSLIANSRFTYEAVANKKYLIHRQLFNPNQLSKVATKLYPSFTSSMPAGEYGGDVNLHRNFIFFQVNTTVPNKSAAVLLYNKELPYQQRAQVNRYLRSLEWR